MICKHCRGNLETREGRLWARVGGFTCVPPFGMGPTREAHELEEGRDNQ
jgi:hypothetical protein